jgi:hypothetical protein
MGQEHMLFVLLLSCGHTGHSLCLHLCCSSRVVRPTGAYPGNRNIWHDIKLHQWDLRLAWQVGCHTQAPYGARLHQGVCGTAVAKYVRGTVARVSLIKTGWKSGCPRRGVGKVPSSLGRRAYLSRTRTTRRAKSYR